MKIQERFLLALRSSSREVFLRTLGHRLGVSAREIFANKEPNSLGQAQACNEMMIALWSQTEAAKEAGAAGYPDSEFFSVLLSKANAGDARIHLQRATESALSFFHSAESANQTEE